MRDITGHSDEGTREDTLMQKTASQISGEVLEKLAISVGMMDRALINAEDRETQRIQEVGGFPLNAVQHADVEDRVMRRAPRTNAFSSSIGARQPRAILTDPHGSSWLRILAGKLMQKTASQLSDEVLMKLSRAEAIRLPLEFLGAVGKANRNPANLELRAAKARAMQAASDHERQLEYLLRRSPRRDFTKFKPSSGPLFNRGWGSMPFEKKQLPPLSAWPVGGQ